MIFSLDKLRGLDGELHQKLQLSLKHIKRISNEIMDRDLNVRWDDIAGLNQAKQCVNEMVIWPLLRTDIFKGCRSPGRGLLLFCPPRKSKDEHEEVRRLKAQFLPEMEGCDGGNDQVLLIGEHQYVNAGLAIMLSSTWIQRVGHPYFDSTDQTELNNYFCLLGVLLGLESMGLRRRRILFNYQSGFDFYKSLFERTLRVWVFSFIVGKTMRPIFWMLMGKIYFYLYICMRISCIKTPCGNTWV